MKLDANRLVTFGPCPTISPITHGPRNGLPPVICQTAARRASSILNMWIVAKMNFDANMCASAMTSGLFYITDGLKSTFKVIFDFVKTDHHFVQIQSLSTDMDL